MYYEINVSLNGRHFFATAKRSLITERDYKRAIAVFLEKFPIVEGYKVSASYYQLSGKKVR